MAMRAHKHNLIHSHSERNMRTHKMNESVSVCWLSVDIRLFGRCHSHTRGALQCTNTKDIPRALQPLSLPLLAMTRLRRKTKNIVLEQRFERDKCHPRKNDALDSVHVVAAPPLGHNGSGEPTRLSCMCRNRFVYDSPSHQSDDANVQQRGAARKDVLPDFIWPFPLGHTRWHCLSSQPPRTTFASIHLSPKCIRFIRREIPTIEMSNCVMCVSRREVGGGAGWIMDK